MITRRIILAYLCVLVFVLYANLAMPRVLAVDAGTCAAMRDGGALLDRYGQGRGDVLDAHGNTIAQNVRADSILRSCYGVDAQAERARQAAPIGCGACVVAIQATPKPK